MYASSAPTGRDFPAARPGSKKAGILTGGDRSHCPGFMKERPGASGTRKKAGIKKPAEAGDAFYWEGGEGGTGGVFGLGWPPPSSNFLQLRGRRL